MKHVDVEYIESGSMVRRLRVKHCNYVNCCGDVDGCNGIYCEKARWERMTPDEYRDRFQKEPPIAGFSDRANT